MAQRTPVQPGEQYGRLTTIRRSGTHVFPGGQKRPRWECICECGARTDVLGSDLRNGHTKSCGCLRSELSSARVFKDATGERFGRLVVADLAGHRNGKALWQCICDCGGQATTTTDSLRSGQTQSCGCLKSELTIGRNTIQAGHASRQRRHPLYATWQRMHARCYSPATWAFQFYGARGIAVCDRWTGPGGFVNFLADMGEKPAAPDSWTSVRPYWTLDRIDNDGNYAPENCRWADPSTQARNR